MNVSNFVEYLELSQIVNSSEIRRVLDGFRKSNGTAATDLDGFCNVLIAESLLTPWQCRKLRERKYKGFFIGKYVITEEVAKTSESGRYRARHVDTREMVTLLVHRPDLHFEVLPPD